MICTDGIKVTKDEAVELAIHHVLLAAKFFEATPDPFPHEEVIRILKEKDTCIETQSIVDFFVAIDNAYNEAKSRD